MFGHSILKQAQAIRGGAMPSGTVESPLSTSRSRVRALAESSTLQQGAEKMSFGNSYFRMCVFVFVQCMPHHHTRSVLFPTRDSDNPTHPLIVTGSPSATWCATTIICVASLSQTSYVLLHFICSDELDIGLLQ